MRVGVVGHVEWVDFVRVPQLPAPGEIVHADEAWAEPAGGGAVAAGQLLRLAGAVAFFTALGEDELGRRARRELTAMGIELHAAARPEPQRRAITFVDGRGERTITVIGERMGPHLDDPLPWRELERLDAVYLTAGDPGAVRAARRARVLVATPRALASLRPAKVELDALVGSAKDPGERYRPGELSPPPKLVVWTRGAEGGSYEDASGHAGTFSAAPPPGPVVDSDGAGDSFAAGLTFGLGAGLPVPDVLELAARCAAASLTGRGAFAGQRGLSA